MLGESILKEMRCQHYAYIGTWKHVLDSLTTSTFYDCCNPYGHLTISSFHYNFIILD